MCGYLVKEYVYNGLDGYFGIELSMYDGCKLDIQHRFGVENEQILSKGGVFEYERDFVGDGDECL